MTRSTITVKWSFCKIRLRELPAGAGFANLPAFMAHALLVTFGLGIAYFLAAIPTGVAMSLHPAVAAVTAWAGYTAIAAAMLAIGGPARRWLQARFRLPLEPDPKKMFWRVWRRWGMPGLGLLAPVTCGPYFAALIALTLGERPVRLMLWIGLGAIPWSVAFALLSAAGLKLFTA